MMDSTKRQPSADAQDCSANSYIGMFTLLCGLLLLAPPVSLALEVGWAKVDITPTFSAPLAGYGKRFGAKAEGYHDPLFARALVAAGEGEKIAIVATDLLLINRELKKELELRLVPLGLSTLLLYATHTHSGIGGYWNNFIAEALGMGTFDRRIFDFLANQIAAAVQQANAKLTAAKIGSASAVFDNLSVNRRHRSRPVASRMSVIRIDSLDNRPQAAIVNFAAHATLLGANNRLISADYPGVLATTLEKHIPIALFAPGAGGDLSPRRGRERDGYEQIAGYGGKLAALAMNLLDKARTTEAACLRSKSVDVKLPQATLAGALGGSWAPIVDPIFRLFTPRTTELQAIVLNHDLLSAWPGEMGSDVGELLRQDPQPADAANLWPISYANDHIGYILSEAEFARGGYESRLSFFGPKLGPRLLTDMSGMLRAIRQSCAKPPRARAR